MLWIPTSKSKQLIKIYNFARGCLQYKKVFFEFVHAMVYDYEYLIFDIIIYNLLSFNKENTYYLRLTISIKQCIYFSNFWKFFTDFNINLKTKFHQLLKLRKHNITNDFKTNRCSIRKKNLFQKESMILLEGLYTHTTFTLLLLPREQGHKKVNIRQPR